MAFASADRAAVSQINITPLVDVMLVLLVIFMVAAPIATTALPLNLARSDGTNIKDPVVLDLRIDAQGLYLDGRTISATELGNWLILEASREEPAVLNIDADDDVAYARITEVLARAQDAGFSRIAFHNR
ncbi:MAG: biopolymer transporter ExbD [Xanthomonadales bacterium]|nr:biopolymer transporter ExbD [Xanthomonadales bacterium]